MFFLAREANPHFILLIFGANHYIFRLRYGVCPLGIVPLRSEASHKSEQLSQLLYGDFFKIIDSRKEWFKIRNQWDKYEGWVSWNQIREIPEEQYKALTQQTPVHSNNILDFISNEKKELFPIPLGSDLRALELLNHQFDGQRFEADKTRENILKTAYQYLNTPYLWGGKSPTGIDCSGLSQMVYKINGVPLPRDAYQQAEVGNTLSFIEESQPGDLAFFDDKEGKIIHVGILLPNHFILHAHGQVRLDRIDQTGIFSVDRKGHSHPLRLIKSIL